MIVGNGMIANTLKLLYADDPNVLVFASGVSNSKETRIEAFEREKRLLCKHLDFKGVILYFSTCSIFDPSLQHRQYIRHKFEVEALIEERASQYLILRLPNLVGKTDNPNTFFNFMKNRIKKGEELSVFRNATRYFLDTEDLLFIIPRLLEVLSNYQEKLNVVFNNNITVLETIEIFRAIHETSFLFTPIDKGTAYDVDNRRFVELMGSNFLNYVNPRVEDIFRKYFFD